MWCTRCTSAPSPRRSGPREPAWRLLHAAGSIRNWPHCSKAAISPAPRAPAFTFYDREYKSVSSRLTQAHLPRTPYLHLFSSLYSLFHPRPKRDHVPRRVQRPRLLAWAAAVARRQSLGEPRHLELAFAGRVLPVVDDAKLRVGSAAACGRQTR